MIYGHKFLPATESVDMVFEPISEMQYMQEMLSITESINNTLFEFAFRSNTEVVTEADGSENKFKIVITKIKDGIKAAFEAIIKFFTGLWDKVSSAIKGLYMKANLTDAIMSKYGKTVTYENLMKAKENGFPGLKNPYDVFSDVDKFASNAGIKNPDADKMNVPDVARMVKYALKELAKSGYDFYKSFCDMNSWDFGMYDYENKDEVDCYNLLQKISKLEDTYHNFYGGSNKLQSHEKLEKSKSVNDDYFSSDFGEENTDYKYSKVSKSEYYNAYAEAKKYYEDFSDSLEKLNKYPAWPKEWSDASDRAVSGYKSEIYGNLYYKANETKDGPGESTGEYYFPEKEWFETTVKIATQGQSDMKRFKSKIDKSLDGMKKDYKDYITRSKKADKKEENELAVLYYRAMFEWYKYKFKRTNMVYKNCISCIRAQHIISIKTFISYKKAIDKYVFSADAGKQKEENK